MPKPPSSAYAEKLRDPRWQKKRLEVLNYHEWRCDACGNTKKELHVHHLAYFKNTEPWDYPIEFLRALCKDCHVAATFIDKMFYSPDTHVSISEVISSIKDSLLQIYTFHQTEGEDPVLATWIALQSADQHLLGLTPPELQRSLIPETKIKN